MADLITTDVFRFVAVRPAQLADSETIKAGFIKDQRVGTEEGERHLAELLRGVAAPDAARRALARFDLTRLDRIFAAYGKVAAAIAERSNDASQAMTRSELSRLSDEDSKELSALSFDALYIAWLSGADAGRKLDKPIAALRAFRLRQLAQSGAPAEALQKALEARPIISQRVQSLAPAAPTRPAPSPETRQTTNHDRLLEMRNLIIDYDETQRLLAMAQRTRPRAATVQRVASHSAEMGVPTTFLASNTPRVGDGLSAGLSASGRNLLQRLAIDTDMTVPRAAQELERHLSELTRRAATFQSDSQFLNLVRNSGVAGLSKVTPFPVVVYEPEDPSTASDVDMSGKIRPLGIGDLKVVKQKLLAYEAGEVAHIENVLKGEFKERKHRVLDRSETITFASEEETKESERDTQTTDRFELKKEAEITIKEDMSVKAGLTVTGGFGPVTVTAQGDFAYSTSKQQSEKNSANFAREVVDKSVAKIQKKVKTERTNKVLHEVEEINNHGLDNKGGLGHVTGVYRWIDKRYRAQVYNYGRRLLLEFVVPEPAAYFHASQVKSLAAAAGLTPLEPFLDADGNALTAEDINSTNYRVFAGRYNATGVTPPPAAWTYVTTTFDQGAIQNGQTVSKSVKDMIVPEGYLLRFYNARVSAIWVEGAPQFALQVGEWGHHFLTSTGIKHGMTTLVGAAASDDGWDDPAGAVPVSLVGYDINSFAVNVAASCQLTEEYYQKWQLTTFDKLYTAYKGLKSEYDQKLAQLEAQAGAIVIDGRNPQTNREIEKRELKKLSITMMTGEHFKYFDAMSDPVNKPKKLPEIDPIEALAEGRYIQFFEQAFDWDQMTYLFFPYFWGRKSKWVALSNTSDTDPIFAHFLQAGAARVVVPVTPAYNEAVIYFLQTAGPVQQKIWSGGPTPTLDDDDGLFVSIAEEIKQQTDDLAGAVPEGEPWEFTLPTTLVWLQPGPELPDFAP